MIENGMVAGYGHYNIPFEDEPVSECPNCGKGLWAGEKAFDWDGDDICGECLVENIRKLSLKERAEMMCESIEYTEQVLEDVYTAEGYADVLNIDYRYIEGD